jgi:hypothetical protein
MSKNTTSAPQPDGRSGAPSNTGTLPLAEPRARDVEGYEQLVVQEWQKRLANWVIGGKMPLQYAAVSGSS